MKRQVMFLLLFVAVLCLRAQNVQFHYDLGHSLYGDLSSRPNITTTIEMFKAVQEPIGSSLGKSVSLQTSSGHCISNIMVGLHPSNIRLLPAVSSMPFLLVVHGTGQVRTSRRLSLYS